MEIETSLSKASQGVQEGLGNGDDEEHRPSVPDEPPNELYGKAHNPKGIQVKPGGEISKAE